MSVLRARDSPEEGANLMGRLLLLLQYVWAWLRQPKDRNKEGLP